MHPASHEYPPVQPIELAARPILHIYMWIYTGYLCLPPVNIDLIPGASGHAAMRGRRHPEWINRGRRKECDISVMASNNIKVEDQIASVGAPELFHNVFCCFASLIQAGQANWQGKVLHCDCFEVIFCIKDLLAFKAMVSAECFFPIARARCKVSNATQCNARCKVCKISVTISPPHSSRQRQNTSLDGNTARQDGASPPLPSFPRHRSCWCPKLRRCPSP